MGNIGCNESGRPTHHFYKYCIEFWISGADFCQFQPGDSFRDIGQCCHYFSVNI